MRRASFFLLFLFLSQNIWAQSKLPPCPGKFADNKWSNCYGTNMTNTAAIYRGEWLNDQFEGQGTYTYRDGRQYVGQFSRNQRHGKGTFTWKDGAKYVGEYKEDLRSGKGTFTYPDGTKFVGEYRNDRRNGPGTEYAPDGTVRHEGTWKDDAFVPKR